MSEENKYTKESVALLKPLHPKPMRDRWWEEMGIPRDADKIYPDQILYEIAFAMATLSAVFNNDHPDHDEYTDFKCKLNHVSRWGKIEDDLRCLIDDVIEFNRPEPVEYDDE